MSGTPSTTRGSRAVEAGHSALSDCRALGVCMRPAESLLSGVAGLSRASSADCSSNLPAVLLVVTGDVQVA